MNVATIRIYFRVFYALLFLVASTSKVDFLIYYFLRQHKYAISTQYLHNIYVHNNYMHLLYNRNDGVEENHLLSRQVIYELVWSEIREMLLDFL